ncbi:hypothetical protein WICMUC_002829 [Wickerhamomyces mucosus]|uniref:Major facilitator superfamily (MFS) profile domain-containing protein n=1 Tax=Wickerhamomyces mucosus TaxID=1378264 RepID=A0A9P8PN38_9ASCO|nr:hypothetical protein WICMUC_002829 [Wickerhamomyces mucosus]
MSNLFEKQDEAQVSLSSAEIVNKDVLEDSTHNKIEKLQMEENFNFEKEIDELEVLASNFKHERGFFQRILNLEIELNFENKKYMAYLIGIVASIAGLLSGVDQSIISGASITMVKSLNLTSEEQSLVVALMPLGAVLGSIFMTPMNEYIGRRATIIVSCLWYTVGAALAAGSTSQHMMYAARFLLGIGIGLEGASVGVYISECSPPSVRGNLVSLYQFNIALGEVLGYAIAAIFYDVHGGWRFMVGSSLVFSTALLIGLFFLPESPRFLVHKGKVGEAFAVWKRIRDISNSEDQLEFLEMRQAAIEEQERSQGETKLQSLTELFRYPRNRRALFYSIMMITLGQMTGVNAVLSNLATLLSKIGFSEKNSVFMSLVGGGSLLIGTIPAILFMDKFGRRTWGMNIIGFFIGLVLVGAGYSVNLDTNLQTGEGLYLTGLIVYMGFFGSYSCLTWVVPSESFDLKTRSIGMTISSAFLYLWSFIVTYNFTKMKDAFTLTGLTLGFYGGIAFIGIIYQFFFMPETKGKTLEEIDDIFNKSSFTIARENLDNFKKWVSRK